MGSFTAFFLPGGLRRRCLLCTSAQIGDVPPASPVATRSLVFLRTIRIYGFCVGLEIQIYIYIYYLDTNITYIFVCFRLYWNPFLSVSKSTTTHLLSAKPVRQASLSLSAFGLADGVGGWADRVRAAQHGWDASAWFSLQNWIHRPMMPFKKEIIGSKMSTSIPYACLSTWQGDPDDWHPGREEQKLHQICPFWHLSFFYLFSCIVNMLLGFVFIPRISHSEFLTHSNPPVIQLRVWMLANFPERWLGPQIGIGWQK